MAFLGVFLASTCFAQTGSLSEEAKMLGELQSRYPDLKIRAVKKTDIPNLIEVTIRDDVGYVAVKADEMNPYRYFLLGGSLVDLDKRINLTAQAREKAQRIDVKTLALKDALTEKRGKGERVLYVFSDVDCGHCRRLHVTLKKLDNVTIHTFLVPMAARYDSKKAEKSSLVWCDKNPLAMFDKVMAGEVVTGLAGCETPLFKNLSLAEKLSIRGTPTVFFADGSRVVGNQLTVEGFEERLKTLKSMKGNS